MKNIEVEIKLKVSELEFNKCKTFLIEKGSVVKKSKQRDQYFNLLHRNFLSPEYPFEWLRIRESDSLSIINYKHWYPENSASSTHCDEFESEVSDINSITLLLEAIGAEKLICVDKTREKYVFSENVLICLDFVEDLGHFIELEYSGVDGTIEYANATIREIAEELGLDVSKRDNRGYPYLMLEKNDLNK